jgi:hypothetical protein
LSSSSRSRIASSLAFGGQPFGEDGAIEVVVGNPNDIQCWVTEVSLGGTIEVWGQLTGR